MSTKLDPELRRQVIDASRVGGKITCAGCKREVIGKGFEIDHIKAEIDGGAVHKADNLQILCVRKDGLGCHAKKTKREAAARATRRAQLENSPLRRAIGPSVFITGCTLTLWGAAQVFGYDIPMPTPDAIAAGAAAAILALAAGDNYRRWRGPRRGVMESTARGKDKQTPEQRLVEILREVITKNDKGTVKITNLVLHDDGKPESFTVSYSGTEFPDREEKRRADVRDQLAVKYDIRWLLEWDQVHDRVAVRRRPPMPRKINHPGLEKGRKWHEIPIAPDGQFDFLMTPHVLIIGATGSGKTSLLRAMVVAVLASAAENPEAIETWLVDPKEMELIGFEGWPGVTHLFTDTDELWNFALKLLAEMRRRYSLRRTQKVPLSSHKKIVVIIDEFRDLVRRLDSEWNGNPDRGKKTGLKNPALDAISELLAKARGCGIHLVISTQRPEAAWFGGENRANVTGRAGVGALDPEAARMIFKQTVGTDIPASLKGRTSLQTEDLEVQEVQTFWVPNPADSDINYTNTPEDWDILRNLGMPEKMIEAVLAA
jgi:energy-coupling factor transporter ATP-binding protein EcfA2